MKITFAEATHALISVALIVCYTVLTAIGHDGTVLLGALGGYLGGAGVQTVNGKINGA